MSPECSIGDRKMAHPQATETTKEEKWAAQLKDLFLKHIRDWYPYYNKTEYSDNSFEFFFHIRDSPCEIWSFEILQQINPKTVDRPTEEEEINVKRSGLERKKIWLYWDGVEVQSFDDAEEAFCELIHDKREERLVSKWKYFTSPATISAALALLMLLMIATLQLWKDNVPQQLWTIFTAVIAFYFGRGNSSRNTVKSFDD